MSGTPSAEAARVDPRVCHRRRLRLAREAHLPLVRRAPTGVGRRDASEVRLLRRSPIEAHRIQVPCRESPHRLRDRAYLIGAVRADEISTIGAGRGKSIIGTVARAEQLQVAGRTGNARGIGAARREQEVIARSRPAGGIGVETQLPPAVRSAFKAAVRDQICRRRRGRRFRYRSVGYC
jgi:hypothetical protein